MKPIGGYFEWEFPPANKQGLHENAVYLNSGRHALEYILRGLSIVSCVHIPYYTCDVVLQPLQKLGIPWKFYHIDEKLEIASTPNLGENEFLLYTNYFGIKDEYCKKLADQFGPQLIIDNAQALFCKSIPGTNQFYSPRKFMGMPDGGLAVTTVPNTASELPLDKSFDRCSHLLKRTELQPSEGYAEFKEVSRKIAEAPLCQMSNLSKSIFGSVDFDVIKQKRRDNFNTLHKALASSNKAVIPPTDSFECPMVYPYWTDKGCELKKKLIEQEIFVATYWPNVFEWAKPHDLEYDIANNTVYLPIDQRYAIEDMERIVKALQ